VKGAEDKLLEVLPLGRGVEILVRDAQGLIAFAKPAGLLSHPNTGADQPRSLLNAKYSLEEEAYIVPGLPHQRLWLLNRLDSATSGVLLTATSAALATAIRAHFKAKRVHKVYQALVFGRPVPSEQLWRDRLVVEKRGGQIRTSTAGHVMSESAVRLVRAGRGEPRVCLIQLEPRTGRSHQLRVQCAKRHLPIVGDQTYGDFARNRDFAKRTGEKRLFLHSLMTEFEYDFGGRQHGFSATAPLPAEFGAAL
jgi:23S rRNA-/tRNA-specific pseudouridylate synthase